MKFERHEVWTALRAERGGIEATRFDGWRFEVETESGKSVELHCYKNPKSGWFVIDPESGLSLGAGGFDTRKGAVDAATKKREKGSYVEQFVKMFRDRRFKDRCEKFAELKREAMTESETAESEVNVDRLFFENTTFSITGAMKRLSKSMAAREIRKRGGVFSERMTKKVDVLIEADDRNGGRNKRELAEKYGTTVISESAFYELLESSKPVDQKATEVATAVTVETLRELVAGHNVVVTQKNERSCIWVMGETKPLREELKDAGLRWAPSKKAWWYKPQAA